MSSTSMAHLSITDDAIPRWVYPAVWAMPVLLGLTAASGLVQTELLGSLVLMLLGVLGFWMSALMLHEDG